MSTFNTNKKETARELWDTIKFIIIAALIVIPIRMFIFQPFIVSGESMHPTFNNADYLIIDEISYRFKQPERGDVVVFRYPNDPDRFFIKRIIGLPGEKKEVVITEGNYFVMGDNRGFSSDSRAWGLLPKENITGVAKLRLLPFKSISLNPGSVEKFIKTTQE